MPTEIQGNMKCISNPEIKVRGYVLAATVTSKRIFIYEKDLTITSEYENCHISLPVTNSYNDTWRKWWLEYVDAGIAIVTLPPTGVLNEESTLYHKECFDCRLVKGSTKKRPDFWPNNHE